MIDRVILANLSTLGTNEAEKVCSGSSMALGQIVNGINNLSVGVQIIVSKSIHSVSRRIVIGLK